MTEARAKALALPPMVARNEDGRGTAFTVSVDAAGATTGVSARERCETCRVLADAEAHPSHLVRPGHLFPLVARPGGVLERPGHTEAAVDLCTLAGTAPCGVLCELRSVDAVDMATREEMASFVVEHGLSMVTVAALRDHLAALTA